MEEHVNDPVNSPAHYKQGGIETIEDLAKARWYLDREIKRLTKGAA